MLEKSHRFDGDPVYGPIMNRYRKGKATADDIRIINTRVIDPSKGVEPPTGPDVHRVVPTNAERNAILSCGFKKHLEETHPDINDEETDPPDHTIFVEACLKRKERDLSPSLADFIKTNLGDNDIRVTSPYYASDAKIDPILRLFLGALLMIISNEDLKEHNRGNGTMCRCIGIKLKRGVKRRIKNWDGEFPNKLLECNSSRSLTFFLPSSSILSGKKVWTVNADEVKEIICEHYPKPPPNTPRTFRLQPKQYTATVNLPLLKDNKSTKLKIGNVKITQFGVNSNYATTCHKMQVIPSIPHVIPLFSKRLTLCETLSLPSGRHSINARGGIMVIQLQKLGVRRAQQGQKPWGTFPV